VPENGSQVGGSEFLSYDHNTSELWRRQPLAFSLAYPPTGDLDAIYSAKRIFEVTL